MIHSWERRPDEFVGTSGSCARLFVWQCPRCGTHVGISEFLNETLAEYVSKSRIPEDCETAVVQYVLES